MEAGYKQNLKWYILNENEKIGLHSEGITFVICQAKVNGKFIIYIITVCSGQIKRLHKRITCLIQCTKGMFSVCGVFSTAINSFFQFCCEIEILLEKFQGSNVV